MMRFDCDMCGKSAPQRMNRVQRLNLQNDGCILLQWKVIKARNFCESEGDLCLECAAKMFKEKGEAL